MVSSEKILLAESITRWWHQFLEEVVKDLSLGTFKMGLDTTQYIYNREQSCPGPQGCTR